MKDDFKQGEAFEETDTYCAFKVVSSEKFIDMLEEKNEDYLYLERQHKTICAVASTEANYINTIIGCENDNMLVKFNSKDRFRKSSLERFNKSVDEELASFTESLAR